MLRVNVVDKPSEGVQGLHDLELDGPTKLIIHRSIEIPPILIGNSDSRFARVLSVLAVGVDNGLGNAKRPDSHVHSLNYAAHPRRHLCAESPDCQALQNRTRGLRAKIF
jgi:hypothetical protein